MSSSPLRGNGKAPADPNDLESAPLLSPDPDAPSPSSPSTIRKSRFRNGRRDLDADEDEEQDTNGLLGSEDDPLIRVVPAQPTRNRLSMSSICCVFFASIFILSLIVAATFHLWIGHLLSEQAKHGTPDEMAERGLLFEGPSSVKVSPIEDGNDQLRVIVEVEGMAGIDARKALGWETKEDGKWLRRIENRVAKWAVRKAQGVNVNVGRVELYPGIDNFDSSDASPLIVVDGMDSLHLPLSYPTKADPAPKMQSFVLQIPVSFPSPRDLVEYGRNVWETKEYSVEAVIPKLQVSLDKKNLVGNIKVGNVQKRIIGLRKSSDPLKSSLPSANSSLVEKVPNLPTPPQDPMTLVDLVSYSAFESPSPTHPNQTVIAMDIRGLMKDPLADAVKQGQIPAVSWGMPFRFPVSISIPLPPQEDLASSSPHPRIPEPTEVLLARVSTAPFSFPLHAKSAPVAVSGRVVPAGNLLKGGPWTGQPPLSRALSRFVARYLSGKPNDVLIRYDSTPEPPLPSDPSPDAPYPPSFVSDLAKDYTFVFKLPGTNEVPDVFHNLRMEDMKIKLGGGGEGPEGDLLASGRVVGEVVLPEAAKALEDAINAKRIQPDVLVYDGDLPRFDLDSSSTFLDSNHGQFSFGKGGGGKVDDQADYPPNPLPANAFARMRMVDSMPAETIHIPGNSTHNATTIVSATFVDAPLFLLPGRSDVLRRFIGKIVFSGKAKASMKGISSVDLALGGFGEIGLQDIPIEASFMVGRSGVGSIDDAA
ncbi:uncharacterized protein JCM6883_007206 [Sporobolomyces salmoneus]|uniref:uncharacterized protein n=1 Tax=Sporobolomyces salmoneus TaxID=183962 RepID=UPI00316FD11B